MPEPVLQFRLPPVVLTVFKLKTPDGTVTHRYVVGREYTPDGSDDVSYTSALRLRDLRTVATLLNSAADRLNDVTVKQLDDASLVVDPDAMDRVDT